VLHDALYGRSGEAALRRQAAPSKASLGRSSWWLITETQGDELQFTA